MNSRILLIFLYAFTLSLIVQYFFFPKAEDTTLLQTQQVFLQVDKDSLTIPNIPKISIINQSTGTLSLNTCRDITITVDSLPIQGIEKDAKEFCQDIIIPSRETMSLPMNSLYRYFSSLSGRYIITAKTPVGDRMIAIDVEKPGAFRSALSGVFYEPIYNLFIALITFLPGHSLGWAIVVITLIIRLLLLAPQHHMLMSQKKLQVLQPKIKAIQEKYKTKDSDSQAKLGMEMLELYKKE